MAMMTNGPSVLRIGFDAKRLSGADIKLLAVSVKEDVGATYQLSSWERGDAQYLRRRHWDFGPNRERS